jgi:hypothetical protein
VISHNLALWLSKPDTFSTACCVIRLNALGLDKPHAKEGEKSGEENSGRGRHEGASSKDDGDEQVQ